MAEIEAGTTLREQLASALEASETPDVNPPVETPTVETLEGETAEQKAERIRDEKGRFAPEPKAATAPTAAPVVPPVDAPLDRPSTWKKVDEWNALPRAIQEEIRRREADYAKGVSTYKQEWEATKPLQEALAPFLPTLQQHNIDPGQWITNLGTAHQRLALGSPQARGRLRNTREARSARR
jgi:hypothetical protein